ncbi:MAG TPA: hypothetical protein VIC35_03770 [Acidimicrobiia bacterium]
MGAAVFAAIARTLGDCARAVGLQVPAFRSPPRIPGAVRTIRRYPGGAVIAVRVRDRPLAAVVDDMVEGVLVANRLTAPASMRLRRALRDAVRPPEIDLRVPDPPSLPSGARMAERQTQAA